MGNLFGIDDDKREESEVVDNEMLRLRAEELDISKDTVQTGEVNLHKEIVEEQKAMDVPVTHEEVIIERRAIDNELSDSPIGDEETIRIPVTEEQVEVGKHTVITGEVSAHKRAVEDTKHVEETLKREEARVDVNGDANVVSDIND